MMGAKRLSERAAPSISGAPSGDAKLRAVVRLLTTPHGKKTTVARLLASECGRAWRSVYRWSKLYRDHGMSGLSHNRADKGVSVLYSATEFEAVIAASIRLRRSPCGKISQEWKALGLPGSYETFRYWVRRLQAFGYVEALHVAGREERSA